MQIKLIVALPALASTMLYANSIFYVGKTYDFAEADMLEAIYAHISDNKEEIEKKLDNIKKEAKDKIENMTPKITRELRKATKNREFYANMEYVNPKDIRDDKGRILYRAGYKFDPMDYVSVPYSLVFINPENKQEVEWLKSAEILNSAAYKVLVVSGKYKEVANTLGQHVYFASNQILERMNIVATPSIATQVKNKLKITEVCVDCNSTEQKKN